MSAPDMEITARLGVDDSDLDKGLTNAESKAKSSAERLGGIAKGAGLAIGGAVVAAGAAAVKFGSQFETAMAGASTLFGDVNVDSDALNDKMLALSDSTGIAADALGNTLYNALSAGIPVTEDMGEATAFLEQSAKLAKAGFTDIDTAMTATVKTMNAYGASAEDAEKYQKILMQTQNKGIVTVGELGGVLSNVTPTAAAMGVEFEQIGAAIAVMTAKGTPAAQATTQLNSLFAELGVNGTKASDNLIAAAEGTEYAGMSFKDMMDAGVPLNDVLDMMGEYAESTGGGMLDMFGSVEAGKAALSMSGDNAASFTDALSAMSTETDVVGEAFDKVSDTSADKFGKIMNSLQNTAIDLFTALEPLISQILEILPGLIDQLLPPIMEMVETLLPIFLDIFNQIMPLLADLISAVLPPLVELLGLWAESMLPLVQKVMPVLIELIEKLLPPLMDILEKVLPPLVDVLLLLLEPLLDLIDLILPPLIDLIDKLTPIFEYLGEVIEAVAYIISDYFKKKFEEMEPAISVLSDAIKKVIDFLKNVFTTDWEEVWTNIVEMFKNIFNTIPEFIENTLNKVIEAINELINGINGISGTVGIEAIPNIPEVKLPRFKTGIDYIPGDDFPALLHRGEAVLTADEAAIYRDLGGKGSLGRMSDGGGSVGGGNTIYNQTINSPKALSPYETKKHTQSLMNLKDLR